MVKTINAIINNDYFLGLLVQVSEPCRMVMMIFSDAMNDYKNIKWTNRNDEL